MISFALLSVKNSPLNNFLLKELSYLKVNPEHIIFDKKNWSEKDVERFYFRIGKKITDLEFFNDDNHYKLFEVDNHNNKETINYIRENNIDFLVNAGTPRILNENIINSTKFGILNCHPGILPNFRGCCCVEWSIFLDKPVGNTVHWMDKGIDTGPIIKTQKTKCFKSDKYQDIRKRVYFDGFNLLAKVIKKLKDLPSNENLGDLKGKQINGGKYYRPMDDSLLEEVKKKLISGRYAYQ